MGGHLFDKVELALKNNANGHIGKEKERTSVESSAGVSTLTITLVTEEDMGVYSCR